MAAETGIGAAALLDGRVADRFDVDGRPIGEIASRHYGSITTQLEPCPFADARCALPMNRSALGPVLAVWPQVVALLSRLTAEATVHSAWRACIALGALPLWCPEPVPRVVAAAYRASLGYGQVSTWLLLAEPGMADRPLRELGSGTEFHRWLDACGWLRGREQVCAGPPALIGAGLEALARPGPTPDPELGAWLDAVAQHHALHIAHLYSARRAEWEGRRPGPNGAALLVSGRALLHAALRHPHEDPALARRLLPASSDAPALQAVLAAPGDEAVFTAALASLPVALSVACLGDLLG